MYVFFSFNTIIILCNFFKVFRLSFHPKNFLEYVYCVRCTASKTQQWHIDIKYCTGFVIIINVSARQLCAFAASLVFFAFYRCHMGWWDALVGRKIFFIKSENLFMTIFIYLCVHVYKVSWHGRHQRTIKCSSCVRDSANIKYYRAFESLWLHNLYDKMWAKLCTRLLFFYSRKCSRYMIMSYLPLPASFIATFCMRY